MKMNWLTRNGRKVTSVLHSRINRTFARQRCIWIHRFTVCCLIAAVLAGTAQAKTSAFSDTEEHWAEEAIDFCSEAGIVSGYEDGSFQPEQWILVDEFLKMLEAALGVGESLPVLQEDGTAVYWAKEIVQLAKAIGLIRENELMVTDRPITRGEMARLTVRAIQDPLPDNYETLAEDIADYNSIPDDRKPFVLQAFAYGIVGGYDDGTFRESGQLTRAEAAVVVQRLLNEADRVFPGNNESKERNDGRESE